MNKRERGEMPAPAQEIDARGNHPEERSSSGPSLVKMYIALAVALAAAIGLAVMIVLPFYRRIGH
jgi:hypothetical protein